MIYGSGHRMRFLAVRRILWPVFRPKCHLYGHRMRLEAIGRILWPARLREGGMIGMRWPPCTVGAHKKRGTIYLLTLNRTLEKP